MKNFMNQKLLIERWMLYYSFYDYYLHEKIEKNIIFFNDINEKFLSGNLSTHHLEYHDENKFEYFVNVGQSNETTLLPKMYLRKIIRERDIVNVLKFLNSSKQIILEILFQLGKYIQVPDLELFIGANVLQSRMDKMSLPTKNIQMKYTKQNMLILLGLFDTKPFTKEDLRNFIVEPKKYLNQPSTLIFSLKYLLYLVFTILHSTENEFSNDFYLRADNIQFIQNYLEKCRNNILNVLQSLYQEETSGLIDVSYEMKKRITRLQTSNLLSTDIFNLKKWSDPNTIQDFKKSFNGTSSIDNSQNYQQPNMSQFSQQLSQQPNMSQFSQQLSQQPNVSQFSQQLSQQPNMSQLSQQLSQQPNMSQLSQQLSQQPNMSQFSQQLSQQPNMSQFSQQLSQQPNMSQYSQQYKQQPNMLKNIMKSFS